MAATVTNISNRDLLLPDWDQPTLEFMPMWRLAAEVKGIPGETRDWFPSSGRGGSGGVENLEWEPLGVGKTSRPKQDRFVVMIPGQMTIHATFNCRFLGAKRMTDKGLKRFYPYRRGPPITQSVSFDVPAHMSPAMTEKYDQLSKTMLDENVSVEERLAALRQVSDEKHYFAARLVWTIWKQAQDQEVRDAALLRLIDLLEFGTAYEAMPDLLDALAQDTTPLVARKRMLDVLGKMDLHKERPGLRIADVAGYCLPKPVHDKALDVVGRLTHSTNATLAEKATTLLKPRPVKQ
ncbi:MAG: hypothetical protein JW809_15030 [Pirellulales bacterium]|nr:hypothetical protein [Pirellulales bacterium]